MSIPAHVLHQENSRSRPQAVDGASEDLHPPSVVGRVKETLMAKGLTVREEADELREKRSRAQDRTQALQRPLPELCPFPRHTTHSV